MTCEEARLDIGVYVVGALEPAERAELDRHLSRCAECRTELAELAGLPGLLSRLAPEDAIGGPPPTRPELYTELRRRALQDRRRRRRLVLAAACAAGVLVAGGVAAGITASSGPAAPAARAFSVAITDPSTHVTGRFTLTASATDTAIRLTVSHVPPDERCQLVAISRTGQRAIAGSWTASYTGAATMLGSVAIPRDQLALLELETFGGTKLLVLPLHTA